MIYEHFITIPNMFTRVNYGQTEGRHTDKLNNKYFEAQKCFEEKHPVYLIK